MNQTQRKYKFIDKNGLISEPMSEYKERKQMTNWSAEEKEIFKEKYLERPKQFGQIAEMLEKKVKPDGQPLGKKYVPVTGYGFGH